MAMHPRATDTSVIDAASSPLHFSCCCNDTACRNLEQFTEAFKKLQYDLMLAAEIGQALLKTKKSTSQFELDGNTSTDTDEDDDEEISVQILKDSFHELKQLQWEKERANKTITMLERELNSLKLNSIELKKQADKYKEESEKKGVIEQMLREKTSQLEEKFKTEVLDLQQELQHAAKRENILKIRYKKLESNYETSQLTYGSRQNGYGGDSVTKDDSKLMEQKLSESPTYDASQVHNSERNDDLHHDIAVIHMTPIPNSYHKRDKRAAVCYSPAFKYSSSLTRNCNEDPLEVLRSVTQEMIDKVNGTDTRVLNKRLKRGVFNISELSELSNSILEQILKDLKADFRSKLDKATAACHLSVEQDARAVNDGVDGTLSSNNRTDKVTSSTKPAAFSSLVDLIQFLLHDWSTNKMTLNDLQADYVRRIEALTTTTSTSLLPINPVKVNDASILDPLSQHKLAMKSTVASVRASSPAASLSTIGGRTDRGHRRRQGFLSFFV